MFQGFTNRTFEFYMAIRFNNNKDFFHSNQQWYQEDVRRPMVDLCASLSTEMLKIDPELETRPARCIAHINRDLRYSQNKGPYRDYSFLKFRRSDMEKGKHMEFFFDISDDNAGYGVGIYQTNLPLMNELSRKILVNPDEVLEAVRPVVKEFTFYPDIIKRKKIPEDVPDELREWYALRNFYVYKVIEDHTLLKSPRLVDEIIRGYRLAEPLYRLVNGLDCKEALCNQEDT